MLVSTTHKACCDNWSAEPPPVPCRRSRSPLFRASSQPYRSQSLRSIASLQVRRLCPAINHIHPTLYFSEVCWDADLCSKGGGPGSGQTAYVVKTDSLRVLGCSQAVTLLRSSSLALPLVGAKDHVVAADARFALLSSASETNQHWCRAKHQHKLE